MAKKDFGSINTERQETGVNTGEVFAAIETGKHAYRQQGTASLEEQQERAAKLKTQGRKGCKAVRINTAFTPENHEYVKVMSKISGKTMTEFINVCIQVHREAHPEVYEQAKALIAAMEGTGGAANE